jgi:penicillin amidase
MKIFKFILLLGVTLLFIYLLNKPHTIGGNNIPPLGKFLDPYNGFLQNADEEALPFPEKVSIEGLKNSVTIAYDSNYVPHIYTENNEDLFFAQGYVMAQNRLWQMEFQVMAAAGRLSEILGESKSIQNFDRLQRRKGMVYGAEQTAEKMSEDADLVAYTNAFAAGVNTYIEQLTYSSLPFEYKLLNYRPEKWSLLKTALILEYMVDELTGYDEDLENTNALAVFGIDTFNLLFPEHIPGIDPTVPTDQPWNFTPHDIPEAQEDYPLLKNFKVIAKPDPDNGSNNWVISPEKSATGNAILANDPHLGLNLPSLWMMLHLNSPEYNVYGFTFPGALGVTIGFNDSISWGFTNAPRDTRDWYAIDFKDESKAAYAYNGGWREATFKIEEIKIKGKASLFDTVIYTHHGPVVYDEKFPGAGANLALKWGGHEGSMVQKSLLLLNKAKNYEDYKQALQYWDQPPQNAAFASVQGNIALTIAGNFPLKWKGQGKFILDGSNPQHEWQGYIPKEHHAFQLNPERGFVSSANQHSVDEDYPYWFYSSTNEYFRNRRINRLLSEMDSISVEDMMKLQNDNYSIKAGEILPFLLDTLNVDELNKEELDILEDVRQWDYEYEANIKAPVYFEAWWKSFYRLLWDEFEREEILRRPDEFVTIHLLKEGTAQAFIDIAATPEKEDLQDVVTMTFKNAVINVKEWSSKSGKEVNWGNYKSTSIIHLAHLAPLSRNNVAVPGHADAINATKGNHGPSFRMIVEMSTPPQAWGIIAGGQSGNPGSPAYDDMIDEWRDGEYRKLIYPQNLEEAKEGAVKVQILKNEE